MPVLLSLRPKEFVAIFWRLLGRETVARHVFGYYARHQKLQQIIRAAGLGAAAAHLESAEWMPADDCARARAVDINVTRFDLRFCALGCARKTQQ
jgi:hypothetical protein